MSSNTDSESYWGEKLSLKNVPAIVLAGVISAVLSIVFSISFAGLVFNGDLSEYLSSGIGLALLGTLILSFVIPLTCTYQGTVGGLIAEPAIVLGLIAVSLSDKLSGETLISTILAAIMIAGLTTGAALCLIAWFKLGQIGQYVPYPVIGGFLAGLGIILCQGSFSFVLPVTFNFKNLGTIIDSPENIRILMVIGTGIVIWLAQRIKPSSYNIPCILVAAMAGFWGYMHFQGVSPVEIRGTGWLLGPFPDGQFWTPQQNIDAIQNTSWEALLYETPMFTIIFLLVMISALMDASSLELAIKRDINPDRELKAVGISNIICGLAGGFQGTTSISSTKLNASMGAHYRYVGLVATAIVLLIFVCGAEAISYVPKFAIAGLLFYVGVEFLREWLVSTFSQVNHSDYFIILTVFIVVAVIGFFEGFLCGLILGFLFFVFTYSKLSVIKYCSDGRSSFSNVDRVNEDMDYLREHGERLCILKLQGFLFFGTARKLLQNIRDRLSDKTLSPLKYLIIDFGLTNGIDSSAMINFQKICQYAESNDFKIILSGCNSGTIQLWKKYNLYKENDLIVSVYDSLDMALEFIEEKQLAAKNSDTCLLEDPFTHLLPSQKMYETFKSYCEKVEFKVGEYLCRQGQASDEMFLVCHGQVSIYLEKDEQQQIRLRKYLGGSISGQMAMFSNTPRSASIVADTHVRAYTLNREAIARMGEESSEVLISFQKALLHSMSTHLQASNRLIREMGE